MIAGPAGQLPCRRIGKRGLAAVASLVACGLLAGACGDGDEPADTGAQTQTVTQPPGGELTRCQNPDGFSIGFPEGWKVNSGNGVPACSYFDPEPFEVPEATDERVAAITAYVDPVAIDDVIDTRESGEEREEIEIDGLRAVRRSFEAGQESLYPAGTPITIYAIDLSERVDGRPATLFVDTVGTPGRDHDRNVSVLDRMARSVEVTLGGDRDGAGRGGGPDQIGPANTAPVEAGGFPDGGALAFLTDVRVGAHEGFDRIVLELEGEGSPSYRVAYVDPPVRQDGSGNVVEVDGAAFLELRLTPATGVDTSGGEVDPTYDGPARIAPARTAAIAEVVRVGDFEAQLAWVAGVDARRPFAVALLEDPSRLVVDVMHGPRG